MGATHAAITYRDLRRLILTAFALFSLYQLAVPLTTLLLLFLLVFVLAAVLNPLVARLAARGVPRRVSAVLLVGGTAAAAGALLWLFLPALLTELARLIGTFSELQGRLADRYATLLRGHPELASYLPSAAELRKQLSPGLFMALGQAGRYTLGAAVGVLSTVLLFVLVVYAVSEPAPLLAGLIVAIPREYQPRAERIIRRVTQQLQQWGRGSLLLGVIVGLLSGAGLWLLGRCSGHPFPYLLLFSIIAGVGELVPSVGPILSAIPPALVAAGVDPALGLWVLLLFFGIQQLENQLIVPWVMGRSLDVHPLAVIFAVLVMGTLFGLLGGILALPLCIIVRVCWEELYLIPSRADRTRAEAVAARILHDGDDSMHRT